MPPKSFGWPKRRTRNPWNSRGHELVVGLKAFSHLGVDPSGQDSVGGDTVAGMFDRQRLYQRVDRRFRGRVVLVACRAEQRRHMLDVATSRPKPSPAMRRSPCGVRQAGKRETRHRG